jgi:hypothetical protein
VDHRGHVIATANQGAYYQHRGPELASVNVWDFVAHVQKVRKKRAYRNHKRNCDDEGSNEEPEVEHEDGAEIQTPDQVGIKTQTVIF